MFKYALIWLGCAIALALIMGALYAIAPSVAKAIGSASALIAIASIALPSLMFIKNHKAPPAWKESFAFALYCIAFKYAIVVLLIIVFLASGGIFLVVELLPFAFNDHRDIITLIILLISFLICSVITCAFYACMFYVFGRAFHKPEI
ncbi:MAG: ABZJ_00895 family protein [Helicobacteraceae bacterium]|nr:ABZJ_00895 family protein [Helicobacteraceae bacterium]